MKKLNVITTLILFLIFIFSLKINGQFVGTAPNPLTTSQKVGIGTRTPNSQINLSNSCTGYINPFRITRSDLSPFIEVNNGDLFYNVPFSGGIFGGRLPSGESSSQPIDRLEDIDNLNISFTSPCTKLFHWDIDVNSMYNKLVFRNIIENLNPIQIISNSEVASFSPEEIKLNSDVKTNNLTVNGILSNAGYDIGAEITRLKNGNGLYWMYRLAISNRLEIGNLKPTYPYDNYALSVDGTIVAKKMVAEVANWADKVFDSKYKLMPLAQLEQYLAIHKHLPEIPSETQITIEGLDLAKMQTLQMQKIEELTLYILEQDKRIKELEKLVKK